MEQLPQQISSAVAYAVSPSTSQEQRNEAYTFLQQVKDAHQETWAACLNLFLADGNSTEHGSKAWSTEARMFGIQVVGER
jgi:exportin-T